MDDALLLRRIGQTLRRRRKALGLSLDEMVVLTKISRATLSRIETGKNPGVTCVSLMTLARTLSMPLSEMLHVDGEPFPVTPQEREVIETLRRLYPEA